MFSHRADVRTTGRAIGEKTWVNFKSNTGKSGKAWYFESLYYNYNVFKVHCLAAWLSLYATNTFIIL
jgi:hypothetical protein